MGILSHRIERSDLKAGDHIYSWRAAFTYSHHGIYVGSSKVVHFTRAPNSSSRSISSASFESFSSKRQKTFCPNFPDCGFRQPNSGVVLTCLDCFLDGGSLYLFEYGTPPPMFLAKIRGGTCTTAQSDLPETAIHRAMFLLQNGFGNYDVFQNNCEDFALYCKTGLLIVDNNGVGRSGQASAVIGAPLAAMLSSPFKFFLSGPVGVATVTAGMYCMSRYATDIGVRTDVVKIPVEDMTMEVMTGGSTRSTVDHNDDDVEEIHDVQ